MKNYRFYYTSDYTELDFKKLKEEGWKLPTDLPSTTSYQEVLLLTSKHTEIDAEIIFGCWTPINNYTEGYFSRLNKEPLNRKIYLWRDINLLIGYE